jgi:hypothetical protein
VEVAYLEEPVADYVKKAAEVACEINKQQVKKSGWFRRNND